MAQEAEGCGWLKASIDGRLIHDHRVWIMKPPSGGFSFG
jgi:hypothetical protein